MRTYEFMTKVTSDGKLLLPSNLARDISQNESVRVILVVDQKKTVSEDLFPPLAQLISEIKNTPQNPQSVQLATGSLMEHLAHPVNEPDPIYDVDTWNAQWDQIEMQMAVGF